MVNGSHPIPARSVDEGLVIYDQDGNEIGRSAPGENLIRINLHPGVRSITTGPMHEH